MKKGEERLFSLEVLNQLLSLAEDFISGKGGRYQEMKQKKNLDRKRRSLKREKIGEKERKRTLDRKRRLLHRDEIGEKGKKKNYRQKKEVVIMR